MRVDGTFLAYDVYVYFALIRIVSYWPGCITTHHFLDTQVNDISGAGRQKVDRKIFSR